MQKLHNFSINNCIVNYIKLSRSALAVYEIDCITLRLLLRLYFDIGKTSETKKIYLTF